MNDAALAVAFFPKFFQKLGRKYTMMIGAGCFLVGAALQASLLMTHRHCRQSFCKQVLLDSAPSSNMMQILLAACHLNERSLM